MTNSNFTVTQQLVIENPEPSKGMPVSHHEWSTLKVKVGLFKRNRSFLDSCGWKDLGMVFLGIAFATFVSLWLPGASSSNVKIAWSIIGISLLLGVCFVFFQYQLDKRDDEKSTITAEGILEIMRMIETNRANTNKAEE